MKTMRLPSGERTMVARRSRTASGPRSTTSRMSCFEGAGHVARYQPTDAIKASAVAECPGNPSEVGSSLPGRNACPLFGSARYLVIAIRAAPIAFSRFFNFRSRHRFDHSTIGRGAFTSQDRSGLANVRERMGDRLPGKRLPAGEHFIDTTPKLHISLAYRPPYPRLARDSYTRPCP